MDLVTLIICIVLLIIWNSIDKRDLKNAKDHAHKVYHDTNLGRQLDIMQVFNKGVDLNGNLLSEPHSHPKEVQRLVKKQLEKEGIRYYNEGYWNLDLCAFDNEGNLISCAGKKPNRMTGGFYP